MTEPGSEYLAVTGAQYQTKVTVFAGSGPGAWEKCLKPDSRRWYVRFESSTGGNLMAQIVAGESIPPLNTGQTQTAPVEWKYRDAPSVVTGSVWTNIGIGTALLITECLYIGG